ncbi:MAG: endolytic transglycosylase MltG [Bacteroidetes bacterium]|nr:endolytic transglycosylase MltG [Bacteroidota bacterium]
MAKKKNKFLLILIVALGIIGFGAYYIYNNFIGDKINLKNKNYTYIYIETNDDFEDVIKTLENELEIKEGKPFEWLAKKMELDKNIHPGKYRINNGMTKRQIINLIKYNKNEKVKLSYNSQIHTIEEFISYTSDKLELNEEDLEEFLMDDNYLEDHFNLDPDNAFALIPLNTIEVNWAISASDLFNLFKENYNNLWNENRIKLAKKIGYKKSEVITLASIVQSESGISSEQQKIAGVYINRLERNMELQADPTLKFANKNFTAQRVLNVDKEIDSPYNTYKYKGLPPGPICLVDVKTIDNVLNYTKHNYLFFCAKPSLNGYSDFSDTYEKHKKYAVAYQKEMNKRGINR